ncbi:MAG: hypothetical protein ABSH14_09185 [Verrucomicrobiia bacterium]|jgi:hypothetical protein
MRDFFIAGTPGIGKTSFGDWLQERHSYLHVDMEVFQDRALHSKWKDGLAKNDISGFASSVRATGKPVVLTWGFPPELLLFIRALSSLGFVCFWFDAPEMLARDAFLARQTATEEEFDDQVAKIRASQKGLLNFFDRRCISVMLGRRHFRDRKDIFDQMLSTEKD